MRYKLTKHSTRPQWWVLADTENNIVLQFEQHRYNETQQVSLLDETNVSPNLAQELAKIMREMGDWVVDNIYYLAMPVDDTRVWVSRKLQKIMQEENITIEELAERSGFKIRTIESILECRFALKVKDLIILTSAMGRTLNF